MPAGYPALEKGVKGMESDRKKERITIEKNAHTNVMQRTTTFKVSHRIHNSLSVGATRL